MKTLAKVSQKFYWPYEQEDIGNCYQACQNCAHRATPIKALRVQIQLHPVSYSLQRVVMFLLGLLRGTRNGSRYILVVLAAHIQVEGNEGNSPHLAKWQRHFLVWRIRDKASVANV
ncbi:hypothetical protein T4D_11022 [Trichinella pseudospiralis]|uniref:Integrase zinc-binding domain-containing protein n=1 Tax=Trichinella pseudospiralis TaxID=6337 RepID=A0A0V1FUU6_TRIPS|nr:hypothetical protein T4D_11022 [Trichinella pseudospiralis]